MRDPRYRVYLIIALVIGCLFALSTKTAKKMRSQMIASFTPLWEQVGASKNSMVEIDALQLENRRLLGEISYVKDLVKRDLALLEELQHQHPGLGIDDITQEKKRRYRVIFNNLLQLKAIPAKVVYRSPAFWDQYLWVNVGHDTHENIVTGRAVVVGGAVVGVLEDVGAHQSSVRLLTDSSLHPSVRVLRKQPDGQNLYLAKGIVHGSEQSTWRGQKTILKGEGFNYDFADEEGPARDLREEIGLIQEGDLLVTTGMDGVFSADFPVAYVTHVFPLDDADYAFEIEAVPAAGSLDELTHVFILP